jgi:hypothetical protein
MMTEQLYAQIVQEVKKLQTPEAVADFDAKQLERVQNQTREENDAEIDFLTQKFLAIKVRVENALKKPVEA